MSYAARIPAQRGAVILAAMVTVTLVAAVAGAAVLQQWKMVEIEVAERNRVQAQWLLRGALDWSRLVLRQDAQSANTTDHLAEPWAIPLQETKLSAFITAHNGISDASTDTTQAYLSGRMEDLQGKLNLKNMMLNPGGEHRKHVQRLFERLGLPQAEFELLNMGLQRANTGHFVMPMQMADLAWLGIAPQSIQLLEPHATLLDGIFQINLNTASAAVIWAVSEDLGFSEAQALVAARNNAHFTSVADAAKHVGGKSLNGSFVGVRSSNFSAFGDVRMDGIGLAMQAALLRSGQSVTTRGVSASALMIAVDK